MKKRIVYFAFAAYLVLLITLVLFDNRFGRQFGNIFSLNGSELKLYLSHSINVIPFKVIGGYVIGFIRSTVSWKVFVTQFFGNLLAFAPFALFLPLLTKINTYKKFLVAMLIIVSIVEILQLFTMSGFCDIDDLILNIAGASIMYGILKLPRISRAYPKIQQ